MSTQQDLIQQAVAFCGFEAIGRACGVSGNAVRKWLSSGLPRTDWTGETEYAAQIELATGGAVTRESLLAAPRDNKKAV